MLCLSPHADKRVYNATTTPPPALVDCCATNLLKLDRRSKAIELLEGLRRSCHGEQELAVGGFVDVDVVVVEDDDRYNSNHLLLAQ